MMTRRAMLGTALAIPTLARADGFPTRPVRMIIPSRPVAAVTSRAGYWPNT